MSVNSAPSGVDVAPGTIVVFADLGCPWAHVGIHRLQTARTRLESSISIDVRVFPLEIINAQPTPFRGLQNEIPALAEMEPDAGWELWAGDATTWPVTTLLPMEAVEAAKEQGLDTSAKLDHALRRALFGESRCISMRHVILDVAASCDDLDVPALTAALDDGRARRPMLDGYRAAAGDIQGSPHYFLADGTSSHNPGVDFHWDKAQHRIVIDCDDPTVYDDLLRRAMT